MSERFAIILLLALSHLKTNILSVNLIIQYIKKINVQRINQAIYRYSIPYTILRIVIYDTVGLYLKSTNDVVCFASGRQTFYTTGTCNFIYLFIIVHHRRRTLLTCRGPRSHVPWDRMSHPLKMLSPSYYTRMT